MEILTVPGWTGSGPEHWQSLWERERSGVRRVEMPDWDRPRHEEWTAALVAALADGADPAGTRRVTGALLGAPPDVERPGTPEELQGFAPIPRSRLPFPSIVAASSDDPWIDEVRARELATAWGARFESLGAAGHVNTAAGFGSFPRGEVLLEGLVATAARSQPHGSAGKLRGEDLDLFDARRFGE